MYIFQISNILLKHHTHKNYMFEFSSDEIDLEYNSSRYRKLLDIKNQLR